MGGRDVPQGDERLRVIDDDSGVPEADEGDEETDADSGREA
jgi:hypothetical protein